MPGLVYILCAVTSLGSAVLLLRGALSRGGGGLLFWSSLCFFAMAANNVLLYMNYIVFPDVDLLMASRLATMLGIVLLNIGLIWHST
jgi:hypothetical protein